MTCNDCRQEIKEHDDFDYLFEWNPDARCITTINPADFKSQVIGYRCESCVRQEAYGNPS